MGIFNTTKINFSALEPTEWPEIGSFIFGFDVADDIFKKIDSNGIITIIGGSSSGGTDTFVTGATTDNNSKLYTFTNNSGGTFTVTGLTDIHTTGFTFNNGNYELLLSNNDIQLIKNIYLIVIQ